MCSQCKIMQESWLLALSACTEIIFDFLQAESSWSLGSAVSTVPTRTKQGDSTRTGTPQIFSGWNWSFLQKNWRFVLHSAPFVLCSLAHGLKCRGCWAVTFTSTSWIILRGSLQHQISPNRPSQPAANLHFSLVQILSGFLNDDNSVSF